MSAIPLNVRSIFGVFIAAGLILSVGIAPAQTRSSAGTPASIDAKKASSAPVTKELKAEVLDRVNEIVEKTAFVPGVDFAKWPDFLAGERAEIDSATTSREFAMAVNKALHKFGFSHIVMATPEAAQARKDRKSVGIGVILQPEKEGMRVLNVFAGSPAADGGIDVGDLIIEGNGKKPESPVDLLGDEGAVLNLKVKKTDGKTKEYKLTRRKYSNVRPDTLTWINKDTAMIKVNTFDISYDKGSIEALMSQAAPAKNLIVDLRSNPGGSIVNLTHLMSLLLPENSPLGTFISRYTIERYKKVNPAKPLTDLAAIAQWSPSKLRVVPNTVPPYKGHIAVLINGGSGSAAEIAAAALRDSLEAPIIGTKSAGAVLVSVMGQLPEGYLLQYPIMDFITLRGVRLEGTGVSPLVETPLVAKYGEPDQAVDKAVMLLARAELRDERSVGHQ